MRPTLDGRAGIAQRRVRVGLVEVDPLDRGTERDLDRATALRGHARKDGRIHLQVPCVIELACFTDRARRRSRIAAALEGHGCEIGPVGETEIRVGRQLDHVVGAEFIDLEGAGADGSEIRIRTFRRACAKAFGELRGLDHRALGADKGGVGEGGGFGEIHPHGARIHGIDRGHAVEKARLCAAAFGMRAVGPGEDEIGRCQRAAVRPCHAIGDGPCDRCQIGRNAAIIDRRDAFSEPRHHHAGFVETGHRLEDQRGAFDFLGAARQIRVQRRGRLPVDDVQMPRRAALGHRRGWRKRQCRRTEQK